MSLEKQPARSVGAAKATTRARMRDALATMDQTRFVEGGAAISRRVLALEEVGRARVVMAFVPMRREGRLMEADIEPLLDGVVQRGARLALPRGDVHGNLFACEVGEDWRGDVVESALKGVLEPGREAAVIESGEIDVVIVPGLAFDAAGGRLGRGKGFYDRFAAGLPPKTPPRTLIGVCLDEQVVDRVPLEDQDILMDYVVTDVRTMRVAASRE